MSHTSTAGGSAPRRASRLAALARSTWLPPAALALSLALAWPNFLFTSRWADVPGSLHGWRKPYYAAALIAACVLTIATGRRVGAPVRIGGRVALAVLAAGACVLVASLLSRLPISTWQQIPFKDDWTVLYQQAVNGVTLLQRGVVVGWNWWFLGGYPTSTDIAQNFGTLAFLPMTIFGERLGYHLLHVVLFLAVPAFVWWDLRDEDRETRLLAAAFASLFAAGYFGPLGSSGDTNSLVGVFCAGLAMVSSRAARMGRRWGGPALAVALTLAAYSHTAFFVYACIYLGIEAAYFRDRAAALRLALAAAIAAASSLPAHWESLRYRDYVSFNNTVYDPHAPVRWNVLFRTLYYNVEILALPHRWFNDYRSLANVWLPALIVMALRSNRTRVGFYAVIAVATQALLRVNTSEAGALFDRIQHMLPMVTAPALAGFVLGFAGSRKLALALIAVIGLYVQTSFAPIRHVPELRAFNPPLMNRIAAAAGNMVLVEISPHRDMDGHPTRRSPTTPFDVHFEGLLPGLAGQRFYSQMIDGWVWNVWRGQVVGAGTFYGRPMEETPIEDFVREMRRWGVGHLFVWTGAARAYLAGSDRFDQQWTDGQWSHFVLRGADLQSVATSNGTGTLRNLDFLGAEVALSGVTAGDRVIVRANYYPAWRAFTGAGEVELEAVDGQLAFQAPENGTYVVRLEYPRYRALSVFAIVLLVSGMGTLRRWP